MFLCFTDFSILFLTILDFFWLFSFLVHHTLRAMRPTFTTVTDELLWKAKAFRFQTSPTDPFLLFFILFHLNLSLFRRSTLLFFALMLCYQSLCSFLRCFSWSSTCLCSLWSLNVDLQEKRRQNIAKRLENVASHWRARRSERSLIFWDHFMLNFLFDLYLNLSTRAIFVWQRKSFKLINSASSCPNFTEHVAIKLLSDILTASDSIDSINVR